MRPRPDPSAIVLMILLSFPAFGLADGTFVMYSGHSLNDPKGAVPETGRARLDLMDAKCALGIYKWKTKDEDATSTNPFTDDLVIARWFSKPKEKCQRQGLIHGIYSWGGQTRGPASKDRKITKDNWYENELRKGERFVHRSTDNTIEVYRLTRPGRAFTVKMTAAGFERKMKSPLTPAEINRLKKMSRPVR